MYQNISWGKVVVLVVAIASVGALGFIVGKKQWIVSHDVQNNIVASQQAMTASQIPQVARFVAMPEDDDISWYAEPKPIPSPKLFKTKTNDKLPNKAWEMGFFNNNSSQTIVFVVVNMTLPEMRSLSGSETISLLFLQDSDLNHLYPLSKYSIDDMLWNITNVGLTIDDINTDLVVFDNTISTETEITSLEYPGFLRFGDVTLRFEGQSDEATKDNMDKPFFNPHEEPDLKKMYVDAVYGDVFFNTESGNFYLRSPLGTMERYSLLIPFLKGGKNGAPAITWNDGGKPEEKFVHGHVGCGSSSNVDDVTTEVSMDSLMIAGKTDTGDTIYEYTDKNTGYLKKWYEEGSSFPEFAENTSYEQFTSNHLVFFWKDPTGRLLRFVNQEYLFGGCGKPVIYLYPEKKMDISVMVTPNAGITVSDPAYGNGWNVSSDSHSNITNLADGKIYPYLFWEGNSTEIYHTPKKGFVTSRENLESLLNEKLSQLGLIQKEIYDFKEFWVPKMLAENKPYYFVTFVPRKDIDMLAPLHIVPQPHTVIRVLMDYKGLDTYEDIPTFSITTPQRNGFTVVEWGGMIR